MTVKIIIFIREISCFIIQGIYIVILQQLCECSSNINFLTNLSVSNNLIVLRNSFFESNYHLIE